MAALLPAAAERLFVCFCFCLCVRFDVICYCAACVQYNRNATVLREPRAGPHQVDAGTSGAHQLASSPARRLVVVVVFVIVVVVSAAPPLPSPLPAAAPPLLPLQQSTECANGPMRLRERPAPRATQRASEPASQPANARTQRARLIRNTKLCVRVFSREHFNLSSCSPLI